jgi:hypothetical protein
MVVCFYRSLKTLSKSRHGLYLMEPEGLLPCSQEPTPTLSQINVDHFLRTYFARSCVIFFQGLIPGMVKYFSRAFRPALWQTHAHLPSYSLGTGGKEAVAWSWPLISIKYRDTNKCTYISSASYDFVTCTGTASPLAVYWRAHGLNRSDG